MLYSLSKAQFEKNHLRITHTSDTRRLEEEYKNILTLTGFQLKTEQRAGQDYLFSLSNDLQEYVLGVFDGHGSLGQMHSWVGAHLFTKHLLSNLSSIKQSLAQSPTSQNLQETFNHLLQLTQTQMKTIYNLDPYSGTTVSVVMVLIIPIKAFHKRFLISINAGDSPIIISDHLGHREISLDHNCDNIKAVDLYLEFCKKNGKCAKPIYYGRINCPGGQVFPAIKDSSGKCIPLEMYTYNGCKAEINLENYEIMSQWFPHGFQTRCFPPTRRRPSDNRLVTESGYENCNWGCTLKGEAQTLTGLGDFYSEQDRIPNPYVSISEIDHPIHIVIGSDGFTDVAHNNTIMDFVVNHSKDSDFQQQLYQFIKDEIKKPIPNYQLEEDWFAIRNGLPNWDDVSAITLSLDRIPKKITPEKLKLIKTFLNEALFI